VPKRRSFRDSTSVVIMHVMQKKNIQRRLVGNCKTVHYDRMLSEALTELINLRARQKKLQRGKHAIP